MQENEEYSIASLNAVYERVAERAMQQSVPNESPGTCGKRGITRSFSDEIVREIRLAKTPADVHRLKRKFNCSSSTIYQIRALHWYRGVE